MWPKVTYFKYIGTATNKPGIIMQSINNLSTFLGPWKIGPFCFHSVWALVGEPLSGSSNDNCVSMSHLQLLASRLNNGQICSPNVSCKLYRYQSIGIFRYFFFIQFSVYMSTSDTIWLHWSTLDLQLTKLKWSMINSFDLIWFLLLFFPNIYMYLYAF